MNQQQNQVYERSHLQSGIQSLAVPSIGKGFPSKLECCSGHSAEKFVGPERLKLLLRAGRSSLLLVLAVLHEPHARLPIVCE